MWSMLCWGLVSLLTTPSISSTVVNTTSISLKQDSDANTYNIEKSSYPYVKNEQSINNNVEYRIYIDTTGDQLTPTDNKIDFNWGAQEKDKWYDLELQIANYKFADFDVNNSNDLISKIGDKFSLSYYYAFNMWDSWKGWRYPNGKNNELIQATSNIDLKTEDFTNEVQYEKADSGTEAGRIQIRQEWGINELKIFLRMSVWYYWASGSVVNHASLTKFSLTDVNNDGSSEIKFDNKSEPVTGFQSMYPGTSTLSLDSLFDNARSIYDTKNKEGWKTVLPLFVSYSVAGSMVCTNGFGYGLINLFSYEPLLNDIAFTMLTGSPLNGKLQIIVTNTGIVTVSSLYYVDIHGTSFYIANAQVPSSIGPISITYIGVAVLAYMYLL